MKRMKIRILTLSVLPLIILYSFSTILGCSQKGEAPAEKELQGSLNQACFDDGRCELNLICSENICRKKEDIKPGYYGGVCLENGSCLDELICKEGTCIEVGEDLYGKVGQRCRDDKYCDEGLKCETHPCENVICWSRCMEIGGLFGPCFDDGTCKEGLVCESNNECYPGLPIPAPAPANVGGLNEPCGAGNVCDESLSCVNGICISAAVLPLFQIEPRSVWHGTLREAYSLNIFKQRESLKIDTDTAGFGNCENYYKDFPCYDEAKNGNFNLVITKRILPVNCPKNLQSGFKVFNKIVEVFAQASRQFSYSEFGWVEVGGEVQKLIEQGKHVKVCIDTGYYDDFVLMLDVDKIYENKANKVDIVALPAKSVVISGPWALNVYAYGLDAEDTEVLVEGLILKGTGDGTVVSNTNASVIIKNSVIRDGVSTNPGGNVISSGKISIIDTIILNGVSSEYGGNIYIDAGEITIDNSTIANGMAKMSGGNLAIYDSDVTIKNSHIQHGVVASQEYISFDYLPPGGGGISATNSNLIINNSDISFNRVDNTYEARGGGMVLRSSNATITAENIIGAAESNIEYKGIIGNSVHSATSGAYGGGIYSYGRFTAPNVSSFVPSDLKITGGVIAYNTATAYDETAGGGIASNYSDLSLENIIISHNNIDVDSADKNNITGSGVGVTLNKSGPNYPINNYIKNGIVVITDNKPADVQEHIQENDTVVNYD